MKARSKGYHARNTKPLISDWLQLFTQMCKIYFLFFQEYFSFRNSTFVFGIILESFKMNYSFLTSYVILAMNISLCKHKSGQMLQAHKQSLTWMPESFDARFPVSVNSYSERCAHTCPASSQHSTVWRPNIHV